MLHKINTKPIITGGLQHLKSIYEFDMSDYHGDVLSFISDDKVNGLAVFLKRGDSVPKAADGWRLLDPLPFARNYSGVLWRCYINTAYQLQSTKSGMEPRSTLYVETYFRWLASWMNQMQDDDDFMDAKQRILHADVLTPSPLILGLTTTLKRENMLLSNLGSLSTKEDQVTAYGLVEPMHYRVLYNSMLTYVNYTTLNDKGSFWMDTTYMYQQERNSIGPFTASMMDALLPSCREFYLSEVVDV